VRPEFLLNVGSAQGVQAQARYALGCIKELASSFSLGSVLCIRFCVVCILKGWFIMNVVE
jgi:hypothetical protein